ncbi:hypothetical protein [Alloacidobacterium sp.]|uniref:hypothetical protein n=1 Tax=Alloacidobacterium sp. TaxID=2951999 RepID=UPI002D5A760E|nr:hypothetical protein [Alloacidobacterium sp.]HYK34492.1 hypothetical protein [Alloacidobacterium sp.]
MNGKIANFSASNRTWFGGCCLMFWIVFSAAIPALAQQDDASASLRQAQAALSNSSDAQPMRPSPAKVPPSFGPTQLTLAASQTTPQAFSYSPMTREERWQNYEHQNFESYGAFFQAFFTGLGDHLGGVPRWDSGMAGLSEHVGSEFATFTIGGTIHSSLAAILHQDTRYFRCSCRGAFPRTLHAVGRTIFTYGDNGHLYPDVSGLAGIYGGPMLMTEWYPEKYTATGYGLRQANIAVGMTSAVYVIREFSPEIKRAFHRRKAGEGTPER